MIMLICLISHIKVKLGNSCVLMFTAVALQSFDLCEYCICFIIACKNATETQDASFVQ
jgi:hypothetical protein